MRLTPRLPRPVISANRRYRRQDRRRPRARPDGQAARPRRSKVRRTRDARDSTKRTVSGGPASLTRRGRTRSPRMAAKAGRLTGVDDREPDPLVDEPTSPGGPPLAGAVHELETKGEPAP